MTHAATLGEAMNNLSHKSFDVIPLDLSLPNPDGITSLLRSLSAARNIPVVVIRGQAEGDLAVRTIRAGAQDFLLKGNINRQWLARSIRFAIERELLTVETRRRNNFLEE